ncbi:hypothetical protein AAFF_G00139730 [Aldrovandia affinis]|uniref:Uncharacterized protein n=1 Tax=Aldrovandia affinis TaxID=143900 RepID=A0AAD7TC69_9TELE|nr:hypothetical protein AAFF_G00139730 [Aldrovandia affinis]
MRLGLFLTERFQWESSNGFPAQPLFRSIWAAGAMLALRQRVLRLIGARRARRAGRACRSFPSGSPDQSQSPAGHRTIPILCRHCRICAGVSLPKRTQPDQDRHATVEDLVFLLCRTRTDTVFAFPSISSTSSTQFPTLSIIPPSFADNSIPLSHRQELRIYCSRCRIGSQSN